MRTKDWIKAQNQFWNSPNINFDVLITDPRDISEIERRKKLKLCQPPKDQLYSLNQNFNGIYT